MKCTLTGALLSEGDVGVGQAPGDADRHTNMEHTFKKTNKQKKDPDSVCVYLPDV